MKNRPLEPSPTSKSRQVVSQPLPAQKARWVFPLVRLQPLEPPEAPNESLPAPITPPYSTLQVDIQSVQTRRLPDVRAPNTLNQPPPVYLLHTKPTSTKLQERAKYAHIPAVYRDKEIGAAEALLGCAILLLIAIFVMVVLYYVASY
ncbi:MAG: hypothetical protein M3Y39_11265 [Chloroflexota bacterium]|nr:hypothetical protein [Chloroflexota bacterium]